MQVQIITGTWNMEAETAEQNNYLDMFIRMTNNHNKRH